MVLPQLPTIGSFLPCQSASMLSQREQDVWIEIELKLFSFLLVFLVGTLLGDLPRTAENLRGSAFLKISLVRVDESDVSDSSFSPK